MWIGREEGEHLIFSAKERLLLFAIGVALMALGWAVQRMFGSTESVLGHGWAGVLFGVITLPISIGILFCIAGALFGRLSDSGERHHRGRVTCRLPAIAA